MNCEQCMNSKVTILGKRLFSLILRDVSMLKSVQSRFKVFIHLPVSWREKIIDKCMEN